MAETVETSKIPRLVLFGALIILMIAIAVGASRNFGQHRLPFRTPKGTMRIPAP